jgi:hypothetical protein
MTFIFTPGAFSVAHMSTIVHMPWYSLMSRLINRYSVLHYPLPGIMKSTIKYNVVYKHLHLLLH